MNQDGPRPDTATMKVIHKMFRREFALLPGLVEAAAGQPGRIPALTGHLRILLTVLHHHHTSEDDVLWPVLEQRAASNHELVETMLRQHGQVADGVERTGELAEAWSNGRHPEQAAQLADTLRALSADLDEHMDVEENQALPLIHEQLSVAEWQRVVDAGSEAMPAGPVARLRILGALFEDATEWERAWLLAELPRAAGLLWRLAGPATYRRYTRALRGTAAQL
ncbi:MAG TPA: hemerythrin domain-containing protein [Pseudonocardia sp.]|jgi:iron-sulfur cluster repair protein YtfE (RIC family)|nr:hemerythrin domain-containing protein [Pseudonocardia sp.]